MLAFTHFPFFIPPLLRVSSSVVLLVHISPGKAQFHIRKLIDTEWNVKSTSRILTLLNRIRHSVRVSAWHQRLVLMTDRHNMTQRNRTDVLWLEEQGRHAYRRGCAVWQQGIRGVPPLLDLRSGETDGRWLQHERHRSCGLQRLKSLTHLLTVFAEILVCHFQQRLNYLTPWHALQCLNLAENLWNKNRNCNRLMGAKTLLGQNVCSLDILFYTDRCNLPFLKSKELMKIQQFVALFVDASISVIPPPQKWKMTSQY